MSENKGLSIEEIIKRAEHIKAEAERQLVSAEQSLNEKARTAQEKIVVDENEVARRIAEAVNPPGPEEDVKEYIPPEKEEVKVFTLTEKDINEAEEDDEDVKIVPEPFDDEPDGKTRPIDLDIEQTAEEKTIVVETEKPEVSEKTAVFVTSESGHEPPDDLEKIPTIVSKDSLVDAFNAEADVEFEEETGEQITFEGFDEKTGEVEKIDEKAAERELELRRREKVGKFRLFGPDETDTALGSNSVVDDDYDDENEKDSFIENLIGRKKGIRIRVLVTGIIGIMLVMFTLGKDSTAMPVALSSHTAYYVTALVLYIAVIITNFNVFIHGFSFKNKLNFDLPVSLIALAVFVHTVALAVSSSLTIDNGILLAAAGAFSLCMSQIGKLKMMSRIVDNFEFITSPGAKYTLENITNAVDAEIISRGMLEEEPRLKMSVKTDFSTNFLEISCKNEPADKIAARIFTVEFILCLALFIFVGIKDNFNTAFNIAMCAFAISAPSSALLITNSQLCDISAQLKDYGSRVCGVEGAVMASNANAVVMEAADLFGKDSCGLHGIKTFNKAKVDDAIINAAAVIVQTKSPLKNVFDDVIIGQQSILPPVEGVIYEERLGTSAWIYDRKVLVGTRELLRTHGVRVPKQEFEEKYTYKGRKALYLAIDGDIVAMFIVSYTADRTLAHELKKLEKNDIAVIVKSADPYITEESLAELFNVPSGFIRVMNYSAARAFDKYSSLEVEKSPAYVVHNGTALGLISALRGAGIVVSSRGLISFLCSFGCAAGFLGIAALAVIGAYTQISTMGIMVFQSIWTAFMYIVIKLRGLGL